MNRTPYRWAAGQTKFGLGMAEGHAREGAASMMGRFPGAAAAMRQAPLRVRGRNEPAPAVMLKSAYGMAGALERVLRVFLESPCLSTDGMWIRTY